MPLYQSAMWIPGNTGGNYVGGPWRIVWHTTEGHSASGAISRFAEKNSWPHFTVDDDKVYQHVDTAFPSRALRDPPGPPFTNRWHAVQIEMVARAALPKPAALLMRAARLARWIEAQHGIVQVWPLGLPPVAVHGRNPGHHHRNVDTWVNQGGHYGHCHVPQNTHWDPGELDISILMADAP